MTSVTRAVARRPNTWTPEGEEEEEEELGTAEGKWAKRHQAASLHSAPHFWEHLQTKTGALDSIQGVKVTSAAFVLWRIFSGNFGKVTCLFFSTSKLRRCLKIFLAELFLIDQFSFEVTNHLFHIISLSIKPLQKPNQDMGWAGKWNGFRVFWTQKTWSKNVVQKIYQPRLVRKDIAYNEEC